MRSAQILALTGLAAAQSTTIIVTNGISTTVVLPNWDVSGGAVTIAVPTGASVDVSVALPDTTTTLVVDQTEVVGTVTETSVPTSFVTVPTVVGPSGTGGAPPLVTVSGANSLGAKSWACLMAFAAAGLALL